MSLVCIGNVSRKSLFLASVEDCFTLLKEDSATLKLRKISLAFFTCIGAGFLWHGVIALTASSCLGRKMWIMKDHFSKTDNSNINLVHNPSMLGVEADAYGIKRVQSELVLFVRAKTLNIRALIGVRVQKLNCGFVQISNRRGSIYYGTGISEEVYERVFFKSFVQVKNHLNEGMVIWNESPYFEGTHQLKAFYHVAKKGDIFVVFPSLTSGGLIYVKTEDSKMNQDGPKARRPELINLEALEELKNDSNGFIINALLAVWNEKKRGVFI
jgi:hypothetical protein